MKLRRHHNNDGRRQIGRGKTVEQVARMARRLGVKNRPRRSEREAADPHGMEL